MDDDGHSPAERDASVGEAAAQADLSFLLDSPPHSTDDDWIADQALAAEAARHRLERSAFSHRDRRSILPAFVGSSLFHAGVIGVAMLFSGLSDRPPQVVWQSGDGQVAEGREMAVGAAPEEAPLTDPMDAVAASAEQSAEEPPSPLPPVRPESIADAAPLELPPGQLELTDAAQQPWTPPFDSALPPTPIFQKNKPPIPPSAATPAEVIGAPAVENSGPANAHDGDSPPPATPSRPLDGSTPVVGNGGRAIAPAVVTPVRVAGGRSSSGGAHAGRRGRRDGFDERGLPIPEYPAESRRRREQGVVELDVEIRPDGGVGEVKVVSDTPYPRLIAAAIAAVRKANFEAATRDGRPVVGHIIVPFRFTME